ncbi:MAG TPA: hypothetical protein VF411_15530 [Bacteroidia bacterium]
MGELSGIDDYQHCIPNYDYGAQTIYAMYDEMIWLKTEINPNGVNENLVTRTFDIQYRRGTHNKVVSSFYSYSVNHFDEVINKFSSFIRGNKIDGLDETTINMMPHGIHPDQVIRCKITD